MAKYFQIPFAMNGDRKEIPTDKQDDGSISFDEGYGADYEKNKQVDPTAKDISRQEFNSVLHDITDAVGEIQRSGVATWNNEISYNKGATIIHNGAVYTSTINANKNEPPHASWSSFDLSAYRKLDNNVFDGVMQIRASDGMDGTGIFLCEGEGRPRGQMVANSYGLQFAQVQDDGSAQTFTFPRYGNGGEIMIGNNIPYVSPEQFGAVGDGVTDDLLALREAIQHAQSIKSMLVLKSVYAISDELEITAPLLIQGIGSGSGYGLDTVLEFNQLCGFKLIGSGSRRRRTRYLPRLSAADADDKLLSVGLNIQSQNVTLRDFDITLNFDNAMKDDHTYLGDDFDAGLFNGCRTHLTLQNVKVIGYFREACIRVDVTRASDLPEFKDIEGNHYPKGSVDNGADGLTMINVYTHGGRWGLDIQGGIKTANGKYFDSEAGLVDDKRGQFGISDVTTVACSFYGADHHSGYRINDFDGSGDKSSGAVNISGRAGNASGFIQGFRFLSTRISTIEPFRLRLDGCNRFTSVGLHIEGRTSREVKDTHGNVININNYDTSTYGHIYGKNVSNSSFYSNSFKLEGNNLKWFDSDDYIDVGGASNSTKINATFNNINLTDGLNSEKITSSGELDVRTSTGLRVREGSTSIANIKSGTSVIRSSIHSGGNKTHDLGSEAYPYRNIHLGNQPIVTSDARLKRSIDDVQDKYFKIIESMKFKQYLMTGSSKLCFGIIAQDWIESCNKFGVDPFESNILVGSEDKGYAVRYGELQNLFNAYILTKLK